ncbi:GFA family protein [Noviherbaspirillum sp.]|uniref:GFA family protein n=1 Tax=Noviherbaspirillum sp. TaxID=1926288 RepID=UPI002D600202|nr:GFA family protein [Noviherbaspirillum sp.]HZW20342.1 GFA family protein [Noviherbaspirillum sp.]
MSEPRIHGTCLCGAVTYDAEGPFQVMVHCHCSRCRKSTGTGHATNLTVDPAQFRWLAGEDAIARYDLPQAKSFGKWFCRHCGCPVPRMTRSGKLMVIPAGSLDVAPPLSPSDHIFWSSRVSWGCPSGGLPTHEEYPDAWR